MHDGVFVHCILRPAHELSKFILEDICYIMLNRAPLVRTTIAVKNIQFRFMSILAKSLVRLLRDNGRFLSVSKYMKTVAPTVWNLLVNQCLEKPPDYKGNKETGPPFNFILAEPFQGGNKRPIATNIPLVSGMFLYAYVEDRKHLMHAENSQTAKAHYKEVMEEEQDGGVDQLEDGRLEKSMGLLDEEKADAPEDQPICGDNKRDKGKRFTLYSEVRKKLLTTPMSTGKRNPLTRKEYWPGECFIASDQDKHKFGRYMRLDWRKEEVTVRFPGCKKRIPYDQALHAITTGGFATAEEEKAFFAQLAQLPNPDMDLFDDANEELLQSMGEVGLRIIAVKKYWKYLEDECGLLKVEGGPKEEALPIILKHLYEINIGSFEWGVYLDEPVIELEKVRKSSQAVTEETVVDGTFTNSIASKYKKAGLYYAQHSLALQFTRACFHKAGALMPSNKCLYTERNFSKKVWEKKEEKDWASEGPLLRRLSEEMTKQTVNRFRTLLSNTVPKVPVDEKKQVVLWDRKFRLSSYFRTLSIRK